MTSVKPQKFSPKELRGRVQNAFFGLENAQKLLLSLFKNDEDFIEMGSVSLAASNE